jgi:hypothetical protein
VSLKSPESVLRTQLVGNQAVSALVGSRVYPLLAPADASLPFITWRRSGIIRQHSLGGPIGTPTVSVEFQIYAATYNAARDLADKARLCLDGYGGTVDTVEVKHVMLDQEYDGFVQLAGSELPPVYTVVQTYNAIWQET